jgi:hypothetical protein
MESFWKYPAQHKFLESRHKTHSTIQHIKRLSSYSSAISLVSVLFILPAPFITLQIPTLDRCYMKQHRHILLFALLLTSATGTAIAGQTCCKLPASPTVTPSSSYTVIPTPPPSPQSTNSFIRPQIVPSSPIPSTSSSLPAMPTHTNKFVKLPFSYSMH